MWYNSKNEILLRYILKNYFITYQNYELKYKFRMDHLYEFFTEFERTKTSLKKNPNRGYIKYCIENKLEEAKKNQPNLLNKKIKTLTKPTMSS